MSLVYESDPGRGYILTVEQYQHLFFVHCQMKQWSPSTLRRLREELDAISFLWALRVFVHPNNTKLAKFAKLCGFEYTHNMIRPHDLQTYEIYQRIRQWEHCSAEDQPTETSSAPKKRPASKK